mgnify:FL=1
MPSKRLTAKRVHYDVSDTLITWGRCVRTQRVRQKLVARDLSQRIGISEPTLRRLEKGDPGVAASVYLSALLALGVFHEAIHPLAPALYDANAAARARVSKDDPGYF